jgi:hypothetical protein
LAFLTNLSAVSLFEALYTDTVSCVRVDGQDSEWFPIFSGVRQGRVIAPDLFLVPMDWLMERTTHRGMVGTTIGKEAFSDLDYADDVALLAEMLTVLTLALDVIDNEAQPLGLSINWAKTKIQSMADPVPCHNVRVQSNEVELVESFI